MFARFQRLFIWAHIQYQESERLKAMVTYFVLVLFIGFVCLVANYMLGGSQANP